jgi:hypothetical protein
LGGQLTELLQHLEKTSKKGKHVISQVKGQPCEFNFSHFLKYFFWCCCTHLYAACPATLEEVIVDTFWKGFASPQ